MNEKSERSGSHPHVNSLAARTPAVIQVAALYAAYPMAFVSAAWITVGRALFGAAGDLVPIFAISFGPACRWGVVIAQSACWVLAFLFGMFIPDYRAGMPVSGMGALVGGEYVGYAAGFGNTFGILTFAAAITAAALAYSANRRGARLQQGVTDEVLEEQARQQSPYDFLD